ncbi:MAG TPA: PaaI family thioesterase [Candidatus Polarisedimenticolia bacterium]|nr:PaaI family thioesterase [Candidatus Polarisedimenticolia bacterium]
MSVSHSQSATKGKAPHITVAAFEALLGESLPMMADWDVRVESIGHGSATLSIPGSPRFLRPGDTVSGPVMMGLADVALYAALLGAIGPVPLAVTSNLTINFLRKPGAGGIRAEATILKLGRRLATGEVRIYGGDSAEMAAHVISSYAIPDGKPGTA